LMLLGVVAGLGLLGAFIAAAASGLPQRFGLPEGLAHWMARMFPLILLVGIVLMIVLFWRRFRPIAEIARHDVQNKLIDEDTRQQRGILALMIPLVLFLSLAQPDLPTTRGPGMWYTQISFVLIVLAAALMVIWGPGFLDPRYRRASNDEHSKALRGRAARFGYIVAIAALCAEFCISQFASVYAAEAIPLLIAVSITLPALYYVIADWRAEKDA